MELNYFKDRLFDLLNESDALDVREITADDRANTFRVMVSDGTIFQIVCSHIDGSAPLVQKMLCHFISRRNMRPFSRTIAA